MRSRAVIVSGLAIALFAAAAPADILWDETADGDLSGDRLNPTTFTLGAGTHSLIASTGGGDLEYLTITIPDGMQFTQLINVSYEGFDPVAFAGIQSGPTITQSPDEMDPTSLLGWAHFGPGLHTVGEDFLDDMGIGFGAIGFTPPLAGGTYAFWLQQLGEPVSYQLDFVIVPSPGALGCFAGAGLLAMRRRR